MPAAALITSLIAAETLVPASWLMSCARSASSATVSRMSAPRCPGGRRGAAATSEPSVDAGVPGEGAGLSTMALDVSVVVGHGWARYLRAAWAGWRKYMIRHQLRKPGWRARELSDAVHRIP